MGGVLAAQTLSQHGAATARPRTSPGLSGQLTPPCSEPPRTMDHFPRRNDRLPLPLQRSRRNIPEAMLECIGAVPVLSLHFNAKTRALHLCAGHPQPRSRAHAVAISNRANLTHCPHARDANHQRHRVEFSLPSAHCQ